MKARIFPILLIFVSIAIILVNYTPGTWLSGWDTLHPEFNLALYLQRIFWGVWQQHQGLGAVAAQSHASELGRLWYFIVGSFLPENFFRYGYFWLTLIIGPLGIFYLLKKYVRDEAAFLGGLFYLLNLGTLQHFYLPLEMFATAYAFLPWLFWAVSQKKFRSLILLFIVSAPMAHTPTLFFINFAALIIFAFFINWRWGIKVFFAGLVVNSFWLLPSLYYVFSHGNDVVNSHISQQFSDRAIATNKEFATIFDVGLIKGFLFDWGRFNFGSRAYVDLFPNWKQHLNTITTLALGYGSFLIVIFGVIGSFFKKNFLGQKVFPVLLISLAGMLMVFSFLGNVSSLFAEGLRFPFTKFSLLLMLVFSVYFGVFFNLVFEKTKKTLIVVGFVSLALIYYMLPAFGGDLICSCMRVNLPTEYHQTFSWFDKQDHTTRIAPFPIDTFYGWGYYTWGYEGAGFRWFGLPQPLLDREFDRWMPQNENYFWEISQAVYSKNLPLFESVLTKYRVNWLLVDENIIDPSSPKALYTDELEKMVTMSDKINLVQTFGKIKIYKFNLAVPTNSFVSIASSLPSTNSYKWGNLDQAYFDLGDYQLGNGYIYPYRTLFTGRSQTDLEFDPTKLAAKSLIPKITINKDLVATNGKTTSVTLPYPLLSHRDGYLIKVTAKNISGKSLLFWIEDLNSRRSVLETYLPITSKTAYFVLPPMEPDGLGYSFHLDNVSLGKDYVENEISSLEIDTFDYWSLVKKNTGSANILPTSYNANFVVGHPNPAFYRIDLNISKPATLILAQSYDAGWLAFGATNHKLINNWANGWDVGAGARVVYIFFWPQLLEFAGFGLLTIFILGMIIKTLVSPKV